MKQYPIFRELPSFRPDAWANDAEARHGKALLEAVCQRNDGSYLLGCAMDYPGFVWEPDLAGVALVTESMPAIMPALRGASFARAWAGVLPYTADNLPIVDALPGLRRRATSPRATSSATGRGRRPAGSSQTSSAAMTPIMDMTPVPCRPRESRRIHRRERLVSGD